MKNFECIRCTHGIAGHRLKAHIILVRLAATYRNNFRDESMRRWIQAYEIQIWKTRCWPVYQQLAWVISDSSLGSSLRYAISPTRLDDDRELHLPRLTQDQPSPTRGIPSVLLFTLANYAVNLDPKTPQTPHASTMWSRQ